MRARGRAARNSGTTDHRTPAQRSAAGPEAPAGSGDAGDERDDGAPDADAEQPADRVSASERLLYGGALRYDMGWAAHRDSLLRLTAWDAMRRLPRMLGVCVRLAWQADRRATTMVAVAETLRGVAQAVVLLGVQRVLAALLAPADITDGVRDALPALAVMAAAAACGALFGAVTTYADGRLRPQVERLAQEQYLRRALSAEMASIEDHGYHKLLESAQFGAASARNMIGYGTRVIATLISLVAAAGVLTSLHPAMLPLLLLMTVPGTWATLAIARQRYRSYHEWLQHNRAVAELSRMAIREDAASEIRVHGVGPFLLHHFHAMSREHEAEQSRLAQRAAAIGLAAAALGGATALLTYLTLGALLWTGAMAFAAAGAAVVAIRAGTTALDGLVRQINDMHEDALFVQDLQRLVEDGDAHDIPEGGERPPAEPGDITVEGLTFAYPGTAAGPVLRDVSLTVPAGRVTALVGENGSGKSTLVKVICGLYLPQHGTVRWSGVDTSRYDRRQLFARFRLVGQDFFRWPFTAGVNVAIGQPDVPADPARMDRAAEAAGATALVDSLPHRWSTLLSRVYQRGHQLSGGQWQKLGIARAAYRDAPVLVVDEPTAALDAKAEQEVFRRIRALADGGRTVILITHRMASVRDADRVHVLHEGRLVESGTPDDLLAAGGSYAEMYDLQAAQFDGRDRETTG
ncbi:ATP-binding cassette domain-containing protein [Streptomyces lonarensis]|uniref:ABC transporter ATP-binding protein n=1 Tax=Streptomyces lonarensis TaxID=700599 RepID=A0A7X6D1K1_9ACTN|nr:ABC transporter ATP-binding protein [Streptomyces lonarensis]NJQ06513.1 ABC transporter ATP-binding protein [Streptomyces lonarensis]